MLGLIELAVGLFIWVFLLWDGFATIVLLGTVAPMRRLSGRFKARLTYRMGLHLLKDLTQALAIAVDPRSRGEIDRGRLAGT